MARPGVGFEDLAAAADALLDAGERPTAERIRGQLGRGSPNTIGPLLDRWWTTLGPRLRQQQAKLALPDAPAEVSALASQLWEQAVLAAQAHAEATVATERTALAQERAALARESEQAQQAWETQQAAVAAAEHALAVATARLAEVEQRADAQGLLLHDLTQQRDALQARHERQDRDLAGLRERLQAQEAAAAVEREALRQHARAVEERAYQEVDRVRQELKALRAQQVAAAHERTQIEQALRAALDDARQATTAAQRDAAAQQARADALAAVAAQVHPQRSQRSRTVAKTQRRGAATATAKTKT